MDELQKNLDKFESHELRRRIVNNLFDSNAKTVANNILINRIKNGELDGAQEVAGATTPVDSHSSEQNPIVRHWRGDFSLGVSYWVIGVFLTIAFNTASELFFGKDFANEKSVIPLIEFYTISLGFFIWQAVGIWRSANNHPKRGGQLFWANLVKLFVALGVIRTALMFITEIKLFI